MRTSLVVLLLLLSEPRNGGTAQAAAAAASSVAAQKRASPNSEGQGGAVGQRGSAGIQRNPRPPPPPDAAGAASSAGGYPGWRRGRGRRRVAKDAVPGAEGREEYEPGQRRRSSPKRPRPGTASSEDEVLEDLDHPQMRLWAADDCGPEAPAEACASSSSSSCQHDALEELHSPVVGGLLRIPCRLTLDASDGGGTSTSLSAYVDTGAQVTVLSLEAARRAGLLHLLDRRYAGRATGVGHCRVLGRIPAGCASVRLGGGGGTVTAPCPELAVLEGTGTEGIDLLLGLDVLEEWGANICMRDRTLTLTLETPPAEGRRRRGVFGGVGRGGERVAIAFAQDRNARVGGDEETSSAMARGGGEFQSRGDGRSSSSPRRSPFEDDDLMADLELLERETTPMDFDSAASSSVYDDDDDIFEYSDDDLEGDGAASDLGGDFDMSGV